MLWPLIRTVSMRRLEPSQRDSSNDRLQYTFFWENMDNYPKIIPVTPSYLEL